MFPGNAVSSSEDVVVVVVDVNSSDGCIAERWRCCGDSGFLAIFFANAKQTNTQKREREGVERERRRKRQRRKL